MRVFSAGNHGTYSVLTGWVYFDERRLAFTPKQGDVIGAAVKETLAELALIDQTGTIRSGSLRPANGIFNGVQAQRILPKNDLARTFRDLSLTEE